ncbi:MAG: aminotransferase class V-fold PLP-dependent enzyme [Deinococcota bacterium]
MRDLQKTMLAELADKTVYECAHRHGLAYLEQLCERGVYPSVDALERLSVFDEAFPASSEDAVSVINMLHEYGAEATVASGGGRYFGFVTGGAVPAGHAAKVLGTYWDQNSAMHVMSPLVSQLELVVTRWFQQIFDLPEQTVAGFVSGTSLATFCGLAAARYRLLARAGWDVNEQGLFGAPQIRVVTSRQAHSTVIKAIGMLGFGKGNIEWVDVDDQGRLLASALPQLDNRTLVILQAGNVNSGSFDPFAEICEQAAKAGAWVHVDGAFGMWAGATQQLRHLTYGIELADSWATDGHKTLNTPYDCGIALCRDQEALTASLHMSGGYLMPSNTSNDDIPERDGMFFTPEMSRRARVIELWATLKYLGRAGLNEMVYGLHERAVQFADAVQKHEGFEVLNDVVFNQVLIQCATDALTDCVLERIQDLRTCWVGGSTWDSHRVIRVSVCSWATTEEDIQRSVASFARAFTDVHTTRQEPHAI